MNRKNLPLEKTKLISKAESQLNKTGLAVEYFPAFTQRTHDFHSHNFIEILVVLKGTFRHVTADQTYDESAGGLTILNYNQFHTLSTPSGPVELMNIYWNPNKYPAPELPEPLSSRMHELIPAHPLLRNRLNRIFHFHMDNPEKITQLLRMLYEEQQKQQLGKDSANEALFRLFLIELCRTAPVDPKGYSAKIVNPRMEAVRLYLEKHYTEPIRLDQLCTISKLRKANLCRRFKEYTGLSTGDYLKQRRLAVAMQKLRTTNGKILTICYDSGFSDIAHFNRTFRAALGLTPSEYRKKSLSDQANG